MVKRTNLMKITLKNSESLFHKQRIIPVTLYLNTSFSSVALFVKSDQSERANLKFLSPWTNVIKPNNFHFFQKYILLQHISCSYFGKICNKSWKKSVNLGFRKKWSMVFSLNFIIINKKNMFFNCIYINSLFEYMSMCTTSYKQTIYPKKNCMRQFQ